MDNIFQLTDEKKFTLEEANSLVPLLIKLTNKTDQKIQDLTYQMANTKEIESQLKFEALVNEEVMLWHKKLKQIGVGPAGIWKAIFDKGDGYYCWIYPEPKILYSCLPTEVFDERKLI